MKISLSLVFILLFCSISFGQTQTGKASFYAQKFAGRTTANGEKFNPKDYTAAHRNLPFGTKVLVTNLANNKSIVVRINDRGPFVSGRIIDLSLAAAQKLDFIEAGVTDVAIKMVNKETPVGSQGGKLPQIAENERNISSSDAEKAEENEELQQTIKSEFYSLKVQRTNPKDYGVQIGSFGEAVNLFRLTNKLEATYNKKTTIEVKYINETKVYSIILGKFSTKEKAETFKKRIQKKYPDSFVINYSEAK